MEYHLQKFSGPLDLLLALIGKAKIDIRDIFVSEVTEQYIQSIANIENIDMDEASEFIEMASRLLYIKTKSLLPSEKEEEEEGESEEEKLIRQLEEYQKLKQIAEEMADFEKAAANLFHKLPEEFPLPPKSFELKGLSLEKLTKAIGELLKRIEDEEEIKPVQRRIVREAFTVPNCMHSILRRVKKGRLSFFELLSKKPTKEEVVTNFLALLELLKLGKLNCEQSEDEDIILSYCEANEPEEEMNDDL